MTGNPAPNAVTHAVTDYAPDPHGWAMVSALQGRIAGFLNGARYVGPRHATWSGWTQQLQQFRGHAGLGNARVFADKSSTMQEQNSGQTVASQIWLDRRSRGN